ncbi:MAG TPA: hypothetical protein VFA67_16475 [Candidatus Sulfotelmatobacter sp.]|nr:hypothetical protein [Candidatus Sulfotelmatobacter sp.]
MTYRANVRVMEAAEGRQALIGVSSNDASLLFDSSNQTARSLRAGDVLLIKGLLARNVVAAETTPDGVVVLTQQAALTDVIQDGDIHLQSPVRFGVAAASSPHPPTREPFSWGSLFVENAYAQSPESNAMSNAEAKGTRDAYGNMIKGAFKSVVEGWETTFKATPGEGKTDLNITLKKNVGGFEALITGQGYISNFGFDSDIAIRQGTIQNMDSSFKNLNGQMNMQWVVAKDSAGIMAEESRIKLPGAIEVPLAEFLEGLPLYLEVSGALLIHPAVTGGKEYSKGQFRISYDGYQHFKVKPGNIDTNGNVTGDIDLGEHQDLSPVAPLGMVVAFCAPRIELMLGLNKIYEESDIKKAAEIVDQIADQVAKRLLSPDKYADYQKNGIHLGQTFKNALSTSGAVYFQTVATSASSFSGNGSISPCSRYDLTFVAQVGASAQAWGQSVGTVSKEIFKKQVTKVDPPGMRLCENIGKS